jgi:hypothetical protein
MFANKARLHPQTLGEAGKASWGPILQLITNNSKLKS